MEYLIKNGRIADKTGCYEEDLIILILAMS